MKNCTQCDKQFDPKGDWQKICTNCWKTNQAPKKQPDIRSQEMKRLGCLKDAVMLMELMVKAGTMPKEAINDIGKAISTSFQISNQFKDYIEQQEVN